MSDYLPVLPDEVVAATILWRLPVKSILQCRCVCKSWNSLITNPNFISIHLLRKTLTLNPQILVGQFDVADKNGNYLLHFENEDYFESILLHLPLPHPDCFIGIIGSINGLICLCICGGRDDIINFILCNPSIRHFLSIPPPPLSERGWGNVTGFGFDEKSQDYKILSMMPCSTDGYIYSLSSNCWRVITCPIFKSFRMYFFSSAIFVKGRFHWLAYGPNSVLQLIVFDLKDETFGHISLPDVNLPNFRFDIFSIKEFGKPSIAFVQRTCIRPGEYPFVSHIWVMKEYGSMESWMKLATIGNSAEVLGFRNDGDQVVIRCKSGCIASQKINHNESDQLGEVKKMIDSDMYPVFRKFSVHKYVPSLALLDKQNDVNFTLDV